MLMEHTFIDALYSILNGRHSTLWHWHLTGTLVVFSLITTLAENWLNFVVLWFTFLISALCSGNSCLKRGDFSMMTSILTSSVASASQSCLFACCCLQCCSQKGSSGLWLHQHLQDPHQWVSCYWFHREAFPWTWEHLLWRTNGVNHGCAHWYWENPFCSCSAYGWSLL